MMGSTVEIGRLSCIKGFDKLSMNEAPSLHLSKLMVLRYIQRRYTGVIYLSALLKVREDHD